MGPALCLLSAACFGAMAVFGKLAYQAGVTPSGLLLLRFLVASALLGGLLALRRRSRARRAEPRPGRRVLLLALGLGVCGYALQAVLYFSALERIDASLVVLVLYTYPLLVTVAAALLGRERLTPARTAAVVLASGGIVLVLLGAGGVSFDVVGVALAFGAAVTYTGYVLVADTVVHRLSPVALSAVVMTGASLALAALAGFTGGVDLGFEPAGWLWIGCIAVVSTVVAMLAFFAGLRRVGPSNAAILSTFEPVVTTALAGLALGELLTPVQIAGGLVVLAAAAVVQLRPRGPAPGVSGSAARPAPRPWQQRAADPVPGRAP